MASAARRLYQRWLLLLNSRAGLRLHRCPATEQRESQGWLWPVARFLGLLPVTFKKCVCSPGSACGVRESSRASAHFGSPTPPEWTGRTVGKGCVGCGFPGMQRSRAWAAYSLFLAATLPVVSIYVAYVETPGTVLAHTEVNGLIIFFSSLVVAAAGFISILRALFTQEAFFMLQDQLYEIDRKLAIRAPEVSFKLLALWQTMLCLAQIFDAFLRAEVKNGLWFAVRHLPFYALFLNRFVEEMMFVNEAHGIYKRLLALNRRLEAIPASRCSYQVTPQHTKAKSVHQGWVSSASSRIHSVSARLLDSAMDSMHPSRSRAPALAPLPEEPVTAETLNAAHLMLCESTFTISRRYGLSLVANMFGLMLYLVTTSFIMLRQMFMINRDETGMSLTIFLTQCLWLALHSARMLALVLPCSKAVAEADRTGVIVGVVLRGTCSSTLAHKQLEAFSMELLHRKISFSICGLFEMGLPIVVSILGAGTTYLVILLQIKEGPNNTVWANCTCLPCVATGY